MIAPFYESKKLKDWINTHNRRPTIDEERVIRHVARLELINKNSTYGIINPIQYVSPNHPANCPV